MPELLDDVKFALSETDPAKLKESRGEVAFVGRSNVGKSSLLNALCRKDLARVSNTPGRTRTINVFLAGKERWLVDLPGYGFALAPTKERELWAEMIEGYLSSRPSLRMVYALIDAKVGPTKLDISMLEWLQATHLPYRVVATKADQLKASKVEAQKKLVADGLSIRPEDVAWTSSERNFGIGHLRNEVIALLKREP